jgi:hypothetical protein
MTAPNPAVQTDVQLVASFRAGDERAATELVRRHGVSLGRFLYAAGAPEHEIEDLVQESFIRAFRGSMAGVAMRPSEAGSSGSGRTSGRTCTGVIAVAP